VPVYILLNPGFLLQIAVVWRGNFFTISVDGKLLLVDEIIRFPANVFGLTTMIVCTALLTHRQEPFLKK